MKIGIDARICGENSYYGQYVCELIEAFSSMQTEHEIIVYSKDTLKYNRLSLFDDIKVKKIFEEEKFALMIFFDHHIPHGYKGECIVVIENLKEVFFPKKKWFARKIFRYKLSKAISRSKKVLCLDRETAMELNEQLNIPENKIFKISGFFPKYSLPEDIGLNIDIKAKYNLRSDYFIYDSGNELHNNFDRILKTLRKLKDTGTPLSLIILCDDTNTDVDIRNTSLDHGISDQIIFLGSVNHEVESAYYKQSSGVIFSSIYESFPFAFSKAIAYNCPIFANDIPANKEVMGESISYLDPLSIHNMSKLITEKLTQTETISYNTIYQKYSPMHTAKELEKIIHIK